MSKQKARKTSKKKEAAELRDFRNRRGSRSVNVTVLKVCTHDQARSRWQCPFILQVAMRAETFGIVSNIYTWHGVSWTWFDIWNFRKSWQILNLESWILSPDFWTFKVLRSFKGFWLLKISLSIESLEKLRRFQSHKNLIGRGQGFESQDFRHFQNFEDTSVMLKNSNSRSKPYTFKTYTNSRFNTYQDSGILNIESGSSSYDIEKLGIPFRNWNLNKIGIINCKILLSNSIKRTGKVTMRRISLMIRIIICDS